MTKPYVFIVGCPRSGTTLLRHIVGAHPQIAITPEAHWIPLWFEERKGLTPEGLVTPDLIDLLLEHSKFANFRIGREDLLALVETDARRLSFASFVAGIFGLYGKAQGKALVGNKTPDSVRRIRTLHTLWPEARFVHVIRDGRDVVLSLMNWSKVRQKKPGTFPTWKDDPVITAALWWELNVRSGLQAARWLGPELYYEMLYESLVVNPAEECAALCAFLDLPYDEAMLRFYETRARNEPGVAADQPWRPITAGLRDWRSQMPAANVEKFEAAAGELVDELGYPRGVSNPRPGSLESASRIRNLLAQDLHLLAPSKAPAQGAGLGGVSTGRTRTGPNLEEQSWETGDRRRTS
jgi:hypothetical protein